MPPAQKAKPLSESANRANRVNSAHSADALVSDSAGSTLAEQLAQRYADRIAQRLLAPGARLPSVREAARRHGISPSTVVGAYDRLQAQGLVQARPQRGFFVRGAVADARSNLPRTSRSADAAAPSRHAAPVDATALIRSMFQAQGKLPAPGMGTLPEEWLDGPLLQGALRKVLGANGASRGANPWLRYGDPAGDPTLRAALSRRLADLGVRAAASQIVTTVGATQALDLVSRTLLKPGDAVLVDEPGWAVEFARLALLGMRVLPVPRRENGPDLEVMQSLIKAHQPRLYVTVSVLHNPTGGSLAPDVAHRLLRLAEAHDITLVEDDTYAWLAPLHATRLAQLDGLQRTVYVSGFSKILTPQWRVGYLAASPALAEKLIDTKLLATLTTAAPLEQAIAVCLDKGALRRHAERLTERLGAARSRTVRLAQEAGCRFVTPPAGLFGWVDVGADTEVLAQRLLDAGWLTAPGALFHATHRPTTLMRVNFATGQDARFWQALARLRPRGHGVAPTTSRHT
jgi:DNA-binding transcriptional MocR family regulator